MKANEAPEKLYVDTDNNFNDVWVQAFRPPFKNCGVEYTRTDAFIEKACEFLNSSSILKDSGIVEKFKIYMKGE